MAQKAACNVPPPPQQTTSTPRTPRAGRAPRTNTRTSTSSTKQPNPDPNQAKAERQARRHPGATSKSKEQAPPSRKGWGQGNWPGWHSAAHTHGPRGGRGPPARRSDERVDGLLTPTCRARATPDLLPTRAQPRQEKGADRQDMPACPRQQKNDRSRCGRKCAPRQERKA